VQRRTTQGGVAGIRGEGEQRADVLSCVTMACASSVRMIVNDIPAAV
jgi:hypothetical protein